MPLKGEQDAWVDGLGETGKLSPSFHCMIEIKTKKDIRKVSLLHAACFKI
jgi:hypothetical protein